MGVVVFTTIDLRRLSSKHVHGRCNVCNLVKNEFDPLWYGRLGLGMTRSGKYSTSVFLPQRQGKQAYVLEVVHEASLEHR